MKKLFSVLLSVLLFYYSFATDDKKSDAKVRFGVIAGINYSSEIVTHNPDPLGSGISFLPGWNVGGYTCFRWTDRLTFQPELLFTLKGYNVPLFGPGVPVYSRRYYVAIPLLLKVKIISHIFILGGPYIGYLMGTSSNENDYFPTSTPNSIDITRWDIGGSLGAGYEFKNGINFGIRTEVGFNNTNPPQNNLKMYNEVGILYFGCTF
jgi:hypothetical protein